MPKNNKDICRNVLAEFATSKCSLSMFEGRGREGGQFFADVFYGRPLISHK